MAKHNTGSAVDVAAVAKDLESFGTVLFGRSKCEETDKQLRMLGEHMKGNVEVIMVRQRRTRAACPILPAPAPSRSPLHYHSIYE